MEQWNVRQLAEGTASVQKPPTSTETTTRYLTKYIVVVPVYIWKISAAERDETS